MTLAQVDMETPVRIVGLERLEDDQRARLLGHGLRAGACVTKLLRTPLRDPIECLVGPQLLALEAWLLDHIEVEKPLP